MGGISTSPAGNGRRRLEAPERAEISFGVIACANFQGIITEHLDILWNKIEIEIVERRKTHIHHCPFSTSGTSMEKIRFTHSHPAAIQECAQTLEDPELDFEPIPASNAGPPRRH